MSKIVDGELILNELCENAMGGTELMINRMINNIPKKYLKGYEIIHSRIPEELSEEHETILVCHDLPNDPMYSRLSDENFRNKFYKFVFVSNWQMQYFNMSLGIPYSKSVVIKNAIEPFPHRPAEDAPDKVKLIYHTTPHRGLSLLLPVFETLSKTKNIELNIYSSFEIYGWAERDKEYQSLFERAKRHPNINYYGYRSNEEVRKALTENHIFAYPSIWPETSCLAAIEALCAGLHVANPNYAALSETCAVFGSNYQWSEDVNQHANNFAHILLYLIDHVEKNGLDNTVQSSICNELFGIDLMTKQWINILKK